MNGANGMSDIEGKVAWAAATECGQRRSFKPGIPVSLSLCSRHVVQALNF